MKHRIAFIAEDFPPNPGGAAEYSVNLAATLAEQGHDVRIVAPHVSNDTEFDRKYDLNITRIGELDIRRANLGLWARTKANYQFKEQLYAWVENQFSAASVDFAVVSTVSMWASPCWTRDIPYAVCVHGGDAFGVRADRLRTWFRRIAVRRILAKADLICANSRFTANGLARLGCPPSKIEVFYCGIDPQLLSALERTPAKTDGNQSRLLTMSRLVPVKATDTLLVAVSQLVHSFPDITLKIAGDGPERPRLEGLARELAISDRVNFLGYISDIEKKAALFREADIYVQSGRIDPREGRPEAFGITFAEAGAAGLPAVGPRIGGVTEVIEDQITGCLVEPDNAYSLQDVLCQLLSDPEHAVSMGHRARERVRFRFDYRNIAATLAERMNAVIT